MNIKMRCETIKITHMEKSVKILNCLLFGKHLNFIEFFFFLFPALETTWKIMEILMNFGKAFSSLRRPFETGIPFLVKTRRFLNLI
jgi:hypothetical protein